MNALTGLALLGGFVALIVGGDVLVRGGSGLGAALRLSPQAIGLTVVAFATSAPELAVTLNASVSGSPGLAVGNVVGSNIANILLVLGGAAVVLPIVVRSSLVKREIPAVIAASILLLLLALDGRVSQLDGALLLITLTAFVGYSLLAGRRTTSNETPASVPAPPRQSALIRNLVLVAVGVALLVIGARWLVSAATTIAAAAGLSDLIIGLTVVAVGTSLPELATSVLAGIRGERELAVGNVVGSCLFNIGAVMGLAALISGGVPVQAGALHFDLPVMIVVAVALLPVVFTGLAIARWEGLLFLAYYVAYLAYLLFDASDHDALPIFSTALFSFAAPLTGVTLALLVSYQLGVHRGRRATDTSSERTEGL